MIWEGKESDCAHMCTHVHARMHTSVQVRGCKWVQMSGRIQWNPKEPKGIRKWSFGELETSRTLMVYN